MENFVKDYDNARLAPFAFESIWGSTQLYKVYLETLRYLVQWGEWDMYINLSEADFPVKPSHDLEMYLGERRGKSFLAGSTRPEKEKNFCEKQGINHSFYQCERFMYTVGKRDMPDYDPVTGFHFVGGSDWYVLARKYAEYLVTDQSQYMKQIVKWYNMSLLSGESFYHTAAYNGPWCHHVLWYNLRNENWQGKSGCWCRKNVVDWCGCSPMVFRKRMMHRLIPQGADKFFARKFDPRIDIHPINEIEAHVKGQPGKPVQLKTYHETLHAPTLWPGEPETRSVYSSLAALLKVKIADSLASCPVFKGMEPTGLLDGHALHEEKPRGEQQMNFAGFTGKMQYRFPSTDNSVSSEFAIETLLLSPFSKTEGSANAKTLLDEVHFMTGWDTKEHLYRRYILKPGDEVVAMLYGPAGAEDPCAKYGGIIHRDGKKCCSNTCGNFCGAYDCDKGQGGASSCCSSKILDSANNVCGADTYRHGGKGKQAPCAMFSGTHSQSNGDRSTKYSWINPSGVVVDTGTTTNVGDRPVEVKLKTSAGMAPGLWTFRVEFVESSRSIAAYEKRFVLVDPSAPPLDTASVNKAFKATKMCATPTASCDKDCIIGAASLPGCAGIELCEDASWSSFNFLANAPYEVLRQAANGLAGNQQRIS